MVVRSKEEILATLDKDARLEGLPFMPEMFNYCGRRLRVVKRAHKTCDPSLGIAGRKISNAVHLEEIRCDGSGHDGCEAGCLIFWKEAWLKRANLQDSSEMRPQGRGACTEEDVLLHTKEPISADKPAAEGKYICQNTHLKFATQNLPWWDVRQYIEDYTSGNVRLSQMAASFLFFLWHSLTHAGLGFGSFMMCLYDVFQKIRGGSPYPWRQGKIKKGSPTPSEKLNLQAGELVRVKPYSEIIKSLDDKWHNRGMYFDGDMVPFTEKTYVVKRRVKQIIDEKTGKMLRFKTDAIILDGVACEARYATCRRFCPRAIYPYWREIWLERADSQVAKNEHTGAKR